MEKLSDFITQIFINTSSAILGFWTFAGIVSVKFLHWCGKHIKDGSMNDLVDKIMPKVIIKVVEALTERFDKIEENEKLTWEKLSKINKDLNLYRNNNHGNVELLELIKDSLVNDDDDSKKILSIVKESHRKKLENDGK